MTTQQDFVRVFNRIQVTNISSWKDCYDNLAGNFVFDADNTPMCSLSLLVITLVVYVVLSYSLNFIIGQRAHREKAPQNLYYTVLKYIGALHNFNMMMISTVCFIGLIYEVISAYLNDGFYAVLCDPEHKYNTGKIAFWMYLYHLSKFIELGDTLLIILRRGPLRFVHTYHHVTTMAIAYFGCASVGTGQWIPIAANTFVHMLMYYYYVQISFGRDVWWKIHLTDIQLTQFVIDAIAFTSWLICSYFIEYPRNNSCTGNELGAWFGDVMVISFFVLFHRIRTSNANYAKSKQELKKD
ncbi:fatty acid elongase [Acrasis kona]|uniref:Elongation of fatty acids protein n=1 Tax=Acrasis kona TaxID=1008807 RepID=A0AAW2YUU6_9EUKA